MSIEPSTGRGHSIGRSPASQRRADWAALALLVVLIVFFFGWMVGVEPYLQRRLEAYLGKTLYEVSDGIAFLWSLGVGLLFPGLVCFLVWAFFYSRWLISNRTRVANEQIAKLVSARRAMSAAVFHLEQFEEELREKSAEAERLRTEVLSLKSLNDEQVQELEMKLKAMESLSRNRIWFERAFAFIIGIASSLAASYFWESLRR